MKEVIVEPYNDGVALCHRLVWADSGEPTYAGLSTTEEAAKGLAHSRHWTVISAPPRQIDLV
jgi:hypothetical protein